MGIIELFKEAKNCKLCYGDTPIYVPLPDPKNGKNNLDIMFVNERPGRIGTGDSGFVSINNNDPSAKHFKECFLESGLNLKKFYSTNTCLCYPKFEGYRDNHPSTKEIKNCHFWLKKQIEIVKPKLIITMGNIALKSMRLLFSESQQLKKFKLKENIGGVITDTKPWIYPLYHTSLRARLTRNAEQQKKDWMKIKKIIEKI